MAVARGGGDFRRQPRTTNSERSQELGQHRENPYSRSCLGNLLSKHVDFLSQLSPDTSAATASGPWPVWAGQGADGSGLGQLVGRWGCGEAWPWGDAGRVVEKYVGSEGAPISCYMPVVVIVPVRANLERT